ncbi:hypothetical protein F5878DRAFT_628284, partial [Lentinula raphanica]
MLDSSFTSTQSLPTTESPTSYLPSIKSLSSFTDNQRLHECLLYLRHIYVPSVRGSRRQNRQKSSSQSTSSLSALRKDPFERAYALRWLSALTRVADHHNHDPTPSNSSTPSLSEIQNDAAALLAIFAGTASAGSFQRQFEFDGEDEEKVGISRKIHITLNDVPLSANASNGDYFGSVGAQTWGGACVLAEEIVQRPIGFFPCRRRTRSPAPQEEEEKNAEADSFRFPEQQDPVPFRVLELGAGTGLVSLVAAKVAAAMMLQDSKKYSKVDIIATDYYPAVLDNLKGNIEANFPVPIPSLDISSRFLDWSSFSSSSESVSNSDADSAHLPAQGPPSPLDLGHFDLILGADIVYEALHASWIRSVVEQTLRKPAFLPRNDDDDGRAGVFHLVIPLRPSFSAESSTIEREFRFAGKSGVEDRVGDELVILTREIILCDADEDDDNGKEEDGAEFDTDVDVRDSVGNDTVGNQAEQGNVVRYAYYVIGWEGTPAIGGTG